MSKRAFSYHYSRPASLKAGRPKISIHHAGVCHIVDHLDCQVPAISRIRDKQPQFVMTGRGNINIIDGKAVIT